MQKSVDKYQKPMQYFSQVSFQIQIGSLDMTVSSAISGKPVKVWNRLTVRLKNNYGRTLCYPVDENAHAFLQIQGGKTLSDLTLDRAEKLGFDIQIEQPNWRDR
tara:strand:+ start:736 stop:1047 length:312 start_codon:yes stop_codon:yes gene_type:complete